MSDERFESHGITFVCDAAKARRNPIKHDGVTFRQAAEAFFDPFLRIVEASRNEETRDAVIGMDQRWNLLFVVHVAFEESFIRIVSARKAKRQEREIYENRNFEKAPR
jgi:uncharacterized DUF497 family protein